MRELCRDDHFPVGLIDRGKLLAVVEPSDLVATWETMTALGQERHPADREQYE